MLNTYRIAPNRISTIVVFAVIIVFIIVIVNVVVIIIIIRGGGTLWIFEHVGPAITGSGQENQQDIDIV